MDGKMEKPNQKDDGAAAIPLLSKAGASHKKTKKTAKSALKNKKKASGQVAESYVRKQAKPAPRKQIQGNALGNSKQATQQMIASYTQTISLWMNKFKIYPDEARQAGMQGRAIVRIRIDRKGNVRYSILTQRTPYPMLDKAVMDMVRRANPVPPVPADYPGKEAFLEYMIPVTFTLD